MPPLVPQSTNSKPRALMRSARALVSFHFELPPSTNRSPGWHMSMSWLRYWSVTPPAGSMSQMYARRFDLVDEVLQRGGADGAVLDGFLDWAGAAIEGHDLVAAARQAVDHVAAHAAEANEAKLHAVSL